MPDKILRGRGRWFVLVGIFFVAAFLRLYQLDVIPPGFHYDEAFNAMQARDVLRDVNRPLFFTGNFGEEPMQMYVEAGLFALAGGSPYTARLSNVLLGLLLIPAIYFCARSLFPGASLAPLSAAAVGAVLYWAVNFSRLGIETGSLPWVLTLSAGALALAQERRDWRWGAVGGLLLGATLYTYLASRLWPAAVLAWLIYLLLLHRARLSSRAWAAALLAAGLVAAPLAIFFLQNPVALAGRAGQVLTPGQFGTNLLRTAGMFFFSGDIDPRDNLPGRPALDPFLSVLFIVGLIISIRRWRQPAYALLLIWFVVMTLPSALTEFAPNFRRAIGALPAVALLCGAGAEALWQWSRSAQRRPFSPPSGATPLRTTAESPFGIVRLSFFVVPALLLAGFCYSAVSSAQAYFGSWAGSTGLYYSFDEGLLQVAQALAARPAGEQLCLSPDYHDHPTVLWALDGRPFSSFDGRRVTVLPNSALATTCAIITFEDRDSGLLRYFPTAQRLAAIADREQKPYAQIYFIPAGTTPSVEPHTQVDARLGDAIRLLGYDIAHNGSQVDLKLYWRALSNVGPDYTVFAHLLGPLNPETGTRVWSQDDSQPGRGTYPTSRWRAGETIIDQYALKEPGSAPAGAFQIEVGMYLGSTGERLPLTIDGQRAAEDRLLFDNVAN